MKSVTNFHSKKTTRLSSYGECKDVLSSKNEKVLNSHFYTYERYDFIVKYKTSFYSTILPIRIGML